jgi:hypothetical protein
MIVNVTIDRITLSKGLSADDARSLRAAVADAVQRRLAPAAQTRGLPPASLERAASVVARDIVSRCS